MGRDAGCFFFGMGLGVAAAVLLAPKSGQETRELIKGKADEGKEFMRRRGAELRGRASDMIDRGKESVARQKDTVSEAMEPRQADAS